MNPVIRSLSLVLALTVGEAPLRADSLDGRYSGRLHGDLEGTFELSVTDDYNVTGRLSARGVEREIGGYVSRDGRLNGAFLGRSLEKTFGKSYVNYLRGTFTGQWKGRDATGTWNTYDVMKPGSDSASCEGTWSTAAKEPPPVVVDRASPDPAPVGRDELALTPEQTKNLQQSAASLKAYLDDCRRRIAYNERQLAAPSSRGAAGVTHDAFRSAIANIRAAMTAAEAASARHEETLLTPEQRPKWRALRAQRPAEDAPTGALPPTSLLESRVELGLSANQVRQLEQSAAKLKRYLDDCRRRVASNETELAALSTRGATDATLDAFRAAITGIREAMSNAEAVGARYDESLLTPEQRVKWAAIQGNRAPAPEPRSRASGPDGDSAALNAGDLVAIFAASPEEFDRGYKGRALKVSGILRQVQLTGANAIVFVEASGKLIVGAMAEDGTPDAIRTLAPFRPAWISGRLLRIEDGRLWLEPHCRLGAAP